MLYRVSTGEKSIDCVQAGSLVDSIHLYRHTVCQLIATALNMYLGRMDMHEKKNFRDRQQSICLILVRSWHIGDCNIHLVIVYKLCT